MIFKKTEGYKIDLDDVTGKGVNRSVKYLKKITDLNIDIAGTIWIEINHINNIRNLFVHNRGMLKGYDFLEMYDFNFDDEPAKPSSKDKNYQEKKFINGNKFLYVKDNAIIIKEGYLKQVIETYSSFYKAIDTLIQQKYSVN